MAEFGTEQTEYCGEYYRKSGFWKTYGYDTNYHPVFRKQLAILSVSWRMLLYLFSINHSSYITNPRPHHPYQTITPTFMYLFDSFYFFSLHIPCLYTPWVKAWHHNLTPHLDTTLFGTTLYNEICPKIERTKSPPLPSKEKEWESLRFTPTKISSSTSLYLYQS